MVAVLVSGLINATFNSMFFMLLLLFLQLVVRKLTIAKILFVALFAVFTGLDSGADGRFVAIALGGITGVLWLVMLLRFGLLAFMVGFLFAQIAQGFPLELGGSHWYSGASAFGMIAIVGITGYGLWLALAGESLFQDELFSEKS